MPTPISPDTKNRTARENSGEASTTMIRAEVKAEDHIRAKVSPIAIARKSMAGAFQGNCSLLDV